MSTPRPGEEPTVAVPGPSSPPARERTAQSRAVPGGQPNPGAAVGEAAAPGPTRVVAAPGHHWQCRCVDCHAVRAAYNRRTRRLQTAALGGPSRSPQSRRWALTDKGRAALDGHGDHADVPVLTRAGLQAIAEQHRGSR